MVAQQWCRTAEQGATKAGSGPVNKPSLECQLLWESAGPQFLCLGLLFQENINIIPCCFLTALQGWERASSDTLVQQRLVIRSMNLVQLGRNVLKQTIKNKKKWSTLCLLQFRGKASLTTCSEATLRLFDSALRLADTTDSTLYQDTPTVIWDLEQSRSILTQCQNSSQSVWTQHWKAFVSQMKRSWIIFHLFFLFFFLSFL